MIKLNSICTQLEQIKDKLEEQIEDIYCRAGDRDRDVTDKEQERIDEKQDEIDAIDDALDYLKDYCVKW